ncbi:MAG: radical SAM protein, partial [Pyrinomonadaceae bacterium]
MNLISQKTSLPDYGPRRLTVELTNICNLHCSYCLRDEDALYHSPADFLPVELFARIARDARDSMGIEQVMFTGGEPTLHPDFGKLLAAVAGLDLKCSFVTNGWHFERVWPLLIEHREAVTHVSFSLDGATREAHDRWRGEGSFARVVRAFSRCWAGHLPFNAKVGIRRDTVPQL